MTDSLLIPIIMTIVGAATPILLAALGELVVEKSGVLNLGVEGMMLIGAVTGFAVTATTGYAPLGVVAAMIAAAASAGLFGFLTLTLTANQVATGLALTIFGIGLSALAGENYVGQTVDVFGSVFPAALSEHPVLRVIFGYSPLVYVSLLLVAAVSWFLRKSRGGLILRAVGESDLSAHSIGYSVIGVRYMAVLFGGAMAGIAGCFYSLVLTPMWAEQLTAGRGWIALALVVFAGWRPMRLLLGAYLFGAVMTLELHAKAAGFSLVAPEFLAAMPYLATIAVLAIISARKAGKSLAPACLGKPFKPSS
ncbi:ABC transporter permease subunit [Anderseniella sp. Alg231-50]|uniref:ABC transporter permease subunit n=1 Tax=Anderseniella sp. Alg231-50 TaxID=1922226 RepID=UPI000D54CBEE